jgi:2,3-bisphosphoglycerate-dependent phosphoglycerate mutase
MGHHIPLKIACSWEKMEGEINIVLVRHGRSRADDERVHEGRYDSPLTDTGRAQAKRLGQDFLSQGIAFKSVISSPLKRAQETAQILGSCLGISVETDADWAEMDNGPLAGLSFEEAAVRFPKPAFRNPYERIAVNGESEWSLYSRAATAVERLIQRGPGKYLVVAHGRILNVALRTILGVVPAANNQGPEFKFGDLGYVSLTYIPTEHRWVVREFQPGYFHENEKLKTESSITIRPSGVLLQDRCILLVKQSVTSTRQWSLPGGHLEKGESIEHCLVRELKEETGLNVRVLKLLYVTDRLVGKDHVVHMTFLIEHLDSDPLPSKWNHEDTYSSGLSQPLREIRMVSCTDLVSYGFGATFEKLVANGFPDCGTYKGDFKAFYGEL